MSGKRNVMSPDAKKVGAGKLKSRPRLGSDRMIHPINKDGPTGQRSKARVQKLSAVRKAARREKKRRELLDALVRRVEATSLGRSFRSSTFGDDVVKALEDLRATSQKFVMQSHRNRHKALIRPFETWLFLASGLNEPVKERALEFLRGHQASSSADGERLPRLGKSTDPLAIVLRAFIAYPAGAAGRQAVSRDTAALKHLEAIGVMPDALEELASKPGEGLEAWRARQVESRRAATGRSKTARVVGVRRKPPPDAPPKRFEKRSGKAAEESVEGGVAIACKANGGGNSKDVMIFDQGVSVPAGTSVLVVTRQPRSNDIHVRDIELAQAERLDRVGAKRLMVRLTPSFHDPE